MTAGQLARRVLGDRWFPVVGRWYRSVFVDLDAVAESFPPPPSGATILDIGGGDGELVNRYLRRHQDARVTMIDLSPQIGGALGDDVRARVEVLPKTSIADYGALGRPQPDLVMISDVVHHVPLAHRQQFFGDVANLVRGHTTTIIVKDVQPGSPIALAAYLADRYISGDRNVQFMRDDEMVALVSSAIPGITHRKTDLLARDRPNYCIVFQARG